MKKLLFYLFIGCILYSKSSMAQTQSIIYDAATIMNAMHGVNGLKIPTANSNLIIDPLTNTITDTGSDSIAPSMLASGGANQVIYSILKRNAGLPSTATDAQVKLAYKDNPFIKDILNNPLVIDQRAQGDLATIRTGSESGSLTGNLLGNLVNGTADFLIKRAQEELSISVFEKLKKILERYPELDTLFPRTCALIKPVDPYEYSKALQAFKDAIHEDLENFVPRISLLYDIPRYNTLNKRVPSMTLIFSASALLGELHAQSGFAQAVFSLSERPFLGEENNYASLLKALSIVSNSITDKKITDPENITRNYIDKGFIKAATLNDPVLYKDLAQVYLGLLWQQLDKLKFTNSTGSTKFSALLEHWKITGVEQAIAKVNTILNSIIELNNMLQELKMNDDLSSKSTGKSITSTQRFILYGNLVSQLLGFTDLYDDATGNQFINRINEIKVYVPVFVNQVSAIIKDFQQEQYNLGIADFSALLKTVSDYLEKTEKDKAQSASLLTDFNAKLTAQKSDLTNQKTALEARIGALPPPGGDIAINNAVVAEKQELLLRKEQIEEALANISDQEDNKKTVLFKLSKIIEYADLLASITKAENSAAVEHLLETYALPAGSSRVKKVSVSNIAVNAYVGGFFARSNRYGEGFTNTYGFTAPIGITFSRGFQKAGSLSLFLGVFDIGNTIQYKLDNDGKYQQEINFAGIISPGVQLVYGLPWYLPLSIGAGAQWISPPTSGSNKIDLKATFTAMVSVDIPLFNLKARKRK